MHLPSSRKFLFLLTALVFYQCKAQVDGNPCDPPPPCRSAMDQHFGISVRDDVPPRLLADPQPEAPANQTITITPAPGGAVFRVEFLQPGRLDWQDTNHFQLYRPAGPDQMDTLKFQVRKAQVDCCPQWVVEEIWVNGRTVCQRCTERQPVELPER